MLKACLLVVFVATCTCGNYLKSDTPQENLKPFQTGGIPEDADDIPYWSNMFDEERDIDDADHEYLDPDDEIFYDGADLTNLYDQNGLQDVDNSEDSDIDHDYDGIDDDEDTASEDDGDEVEKQPMFYQPNMWPFINGFHKEIPGLDTPWYDDDNSEYDQDDSPESDQEDSYDDESNEKESRSLSIDESEEREARSLSDEEASGTENAEFLGDEFDDDLYGFQGEQPNERQARAVSFVPRVVRLGLAALRGNRIRQSLLSGTTVMRKHGRTTHYEKPGTSNTMFKDFYSSKPTNIKDDVIDGAYVGKIGTVGDRKIHYFLHDDEHVYLKPLLSIQKFDKDGNVLVKDVIHYTSN